MATLNLSASVNIDEKEVRLPKPASLGTTKTGMILNSNWGEAKKAVYTPNKTILLENHGKPNKFNDKNWFCAHDYLTQGASELYIVRPIPKNALNNSIKFTGSDSDPDQANFPYYNKEVAKYSIEQLHNLKDYELEIIHRYVTTKENTAVAICSDELFWNQPISNEEIKVIRDIDVLTTPVSLADGETYQVKTGIDGKLKYKFKEDFVIASIISAGTSITLDSDLTAKFTVGTKVVINGTTLTVKTSVFSTVTTLTFDETVTITAGTTKGALLEASANGDILSYHSSLGYFKVLDLSLKTLVFIEKRGFVYKITKKTPTVEFTKTNLEYYLVDENKDGKAEFAVKKIYKPNLYNSNRSIKTFSQIFDSKPNFTNSEFAIAVFLKDEDGLYSLAEKHIVSYLENAKTSSGRSKFAENAILEDSKLIYAKVGNKEYAIEKIEYASDLNSITVTGNLSHLKEYCKFEITNSVNSDGVYTIDYIDTSVSGKTKIFIKENVMLLDDGVTSWEPVAPYMAKVITTGRVNTNRSAESDIRSSSYLAVNPNPVTGKSIVDLTLKESSNSDYYKKDFSMVNTWDEGIDYKVLSNTDLDDSAEIFLNKDYIDVQILISYLSKDVNGTLSVDKMAEIAGIRKDCVAIVGPYNEKEFFGKTNAQIISYLTTNFGTQRENLFGGEFTKFSSYVASYGNMKMIKDTYRDKDIWVSVCGDIAGMLTRLIATKGSWVALAGVENGIFLNAKQIAFNPNKEERDVLSTNSINHIYFCKEVNRPVVFEQYTATLETDSLFRNLHLRTLLITLKEFLQRTLIFKLFKNNTSYEQAEAKERVTPVFERIKNSGGMDDYLLICDDSNNTAEVKNAGDFAFDIRIVPTNVIRNINVSVTSFEYGINIAEYEA